MINQNRCSRCARIGVRDGPEYASNKRKNNILVPLRGMYDDAYHDEIIEKNPMTRVKNQPVTQREAQPFTQKEISAILAQTVDQEKNYFQFAFWSGLRTSELIGLQWKDVDLEKKLVHIRRAVVKGREKNHKNKIEQQNHRNSHPKQKKL